MSTPSTSSSSSSSASSTPTTSTVLATADSLAKCTVKPLRSILKRADSPVLIPKKKVTFIFTTATGAEIENNEIPTASMDWPLNLPNIFGTESGSASYANVLEYDPYTSFTLKGGKGKGAGDEDP
ncbi:uncharacterized protein I303_105590 [Kwoniella dejecticola CBS 10117]|uniref:Uncharacterized protein n=1 Tax=Kwoniella dejecticola CBS 10117 TaxID=1296121 RepID=A0A1A6A220_9TREE|nr:uncharacterized protein I303_04967 [Kwoniella dejecticola CBS 10117]OBR84110.1 hypothetical protein I303_04967 [Kwoniella dejecticola CBS 10117]